MKIEIKYVLRTIALGIFFAVLGLLAGCDGAAPEGDDSGVRHTDAGLLTCEIPSPTGDQPSGYGIARDLPESNFILLENDAREACEAWQSSYARVYEELGRPVPMLAPSVVAGVDCSDAAHDFQGTTGMPWSVGVGIASGDCTANAYGGTCHAGGLTPMPRVESTQPLERVYVRSVALCGPDGRFAGWADSKLKR